MSKQTAQIEVGDRTYRVEIEPEDKGGYSAVVAELPGCITQGETIDEIVLMAKDAITEYLEAVEILKRRRSLEL